MKKLFVALMLVAGFSAAQAEVTGNATLTSDYRFRGVSQTQNAAAVQGGIDFAHSSGFYAGNWNSSISSEYYAGAAGIESDVYAGFKKEIFGGVTVDAGVLGYMYPRTTTDANTTEAYVAASYKVLTVKYSQALTNYFGVADSKNSSYIQADAAIPVAGKLSAVAHYGHTNVRNSTDLNYTDYNVGAAYDLNGWVFAAKYFMNTSKGSSFESASTVNGQKLFKDTAVVSVSRSF